MTPSDRLLLWFFYFVICLFIPYSAQSMQPDHVAKIIKLKSTYHARLVQLDQNIAGTLKALHTHIDRIKNMDESEMRIKNIFQQKKEYKARLAFYDRLIFLSDSITTHSERDFFLRALNKIIHTIAPSTEAPATHWKFSIYLKSAIETSTQESDDISLFVEEFLRSTNILDPSHPSDFLKLRDYTNGVENFKAQTLTPVQAGDLAEQVEKSLATQKAKNVNDLPFEKRAPVVKPVQSLVEQRHILKKPLQEAQIELKKTPLALESPSISGPQEDSMDESEFRVRLLPKKSQ